MESESQPSRPNVVIQFFKRVGEIQQGLLDRATPHMGFRWIATFLLFILYFLRVYLLQGWYIVTYALGIYLLNLFIGFLTPKIDPSLNMDSDEDGPELPTKSSDEFKPFMRRLPEFKFWYSGTKAVVVATFCTFFDAFNIPVFWPILVMYFIILFVITMKRQIKGRVVEPLKDFHKDEVRCIGRDIGLPDELVSRHPFPGPGLAIRVICAEEPYMCKDFAETAIIVKFIVEFAQASKTPHNLLNKIMKSTWKEEQDFLETFSQEVSLTATLLPIQTVGVQGDCRSYSYVVGLSSNTDPKQLDWNKMMHLAKLIPRICHNINRVVYIFGEAVKFPVEDITPTYLTEGVLSTLRQADYLATKVLIDSKCAHKLSQMPVVIVPVHFDRDLTQHQPSCQRSIVIRTFLTHDFMTGIAAQPNKHLPLAVIEDIVAAIETVPGISRVMYDLSSKPPGTTEWE